MKKIKLIFISLAMTLGLLSFAVPVSAGTGSDAVCEGIGASTANGNCAESTDGVTVPGVVRSVIRILTFILGGAGIIMIVVGGIKYTTSRGDAGAIKSAKDTILYALIGLVIAALGQLLIRFVLTEASKSAEPSCTIVGEC